MIDPYEPKLGLAPVRLNVQIVIFTHEDPTHFSLQELAGDPHLVTGAGEFEIKAVAMTGTQTYHEPKKGTERGTNFIYTVQIDDLRICHLGHLAHGLSEDQLEGIGSKIDVLFVPIGGGSHIHSAQATAIVNQIETETVVSTSYKMPGLKPPARNPEGV